MDIEIDPEFKALIPPLAPEEYAGLEESLLKWGCQDALKTWNGILIDGHNRHEICERHGIAFETQPIEFESRAHVRVWMRSFQKDRRNLTPAWKIELELSNKADLLEIGKRAMAEKKDGNAHASKTTLSQNDKVDLPPVNTQKEIAKAAGVSTGQVGMAEQLKKKAPALWEKAKTGDTSITQAYQQLRHKEKQEKREEKQVATAKAVVETAETARRDISSVCEIRHCSCADLLSSGIIPDAVITDPPYPREFLPVFTELAESCAKAGVKTIAVMSGQSYLPEVYERMAAHLRYRWTMAYLTPGGQAVQQWQAKVNTFWKPILIFGDAEEWFGDVAKSEANDNDKRFHKWGQSVTGMADLIDRLTKPGALVCDPFCGGGATALAAFATGRKFIGCDIDETKVEESKTRIKNAILEN